MLWVAPAILLLLGTCWGKQVPEDLQSLQEKLTSSIPIEEVLENVKERCEKHGGSEAFDKLKSSMESLKSCIQSNFDGNQIKDEIAIKRKTGDLDEVFEKYCSRVPKAKECVKTAMNALGSCMDTTEKESLDLVYSIADSLATFACFKDGDRIAMFIAEGGPECISSKQSEIEQCANKTLSHRIPSDFSLDTLNNLPLLTDNTEGCSDFSKLQACVVESLETCDDSTPANIVDALFKFVRRVSPCKEVKN